jgi:hypothetical protein
VKKLHTAAIALFALALAFYFLSWLPGAFGFAALGVVAEIGAWVVIFSSGGSGSQQHTDHTPENQERDTL